MLVMKSAVEMLGTDIVAIKMSLINLDFNSLTLGLVSGRQPGTDNWSDNILCDRSIDCSVLVYHCLPLQEEN